MWRHKPTGVSIGLTRLVDLNSDRTLSIRDEIDAVSTGFSFLADFDGFYHSFFDMIEDDDEEGGCAERIYPDNEIDFFDKTNESLDGLNKEYARMFNKYFRGYWEEHGYSVE